ncbi:MAG TPA: ABC transporter substrate-binding protein [Chloroflexota bacterium]|jgi:NitT/TauT family transport system substrate-binding protein
MAVRLTTLAALAVLAALLVACAGASSTPAAPASAPLPAAESPTAAPGGGGAAPVAGDGAASAGGGAAPASASSGPALHTSAAYQAIGAASAPIWVTEEAGLFAKHGLDVDVQYLQGNASYAALIAGQIDFLFGNPHNFVSLEAEGADVKVLACFKPIVSDYTIMATPEIHQAADLRGKLIATGGTSDLTQAYFDEYFRRNNVRPDDVTYVRVGGQPERADALRGGAAQATMLNTPANVVLEREGMRRLAKMDDLRLPSATRCVTTLPSLLEQRPEVAERFLKAMIETAQFMVVHRDQAEPIVRQRLKIEDQELMDATYATAAANDRDPVVPVEGLQASAAALADENPHTLDLDVRRMIDTSVLDRIRQSGFIDVLYQ